jgi:plastocyanin
MSMFSQQTKARVLIVLLSILLLAGCGETATAHGPGTPGSIATISSGPHTHLILIPGTDLFAPYITVADAGDTISWINDDTVLHTIVTTPTQEGGAINPIQFQFVLPPGKQVSIILTVPGIYYYYCAAHAALNSQNRAVAFRSVRPYPLAMDGIIYLRGTGLSGVANATVTIASTNQFDPWLAIVNAGATVTWVNQTHRSQRIQTVPGYGPVDPTPFTLQIAPGASESLTFKTPGIYDYYATGSAGLDREWMRPVALPGVAGYPVPMEGIIAVLSGTDPGSSS